MKKSELYCKNCPSLKYEEYFDSGHGSILELWYECKISEKKIPKSIISKKKRPKDCPLNKILE